MKTVKHQEIAANNGVNTALEGRPREDNPYPVNHPARQWWDLGWLEVEDEDKLQQIAKESENLMKKYRKEKQ